MSKISNITDLRRFAISTIHKLSKREIEIQEAEATSNLCHMVLETTKVEMMYAKLCGKEPDIEFLQKDKETPKLIEQDDL